MNHNSCFPEEEYLEEECLDDGYDSGSEIGFEITDYYNGQTYKHTYNVPYVPIHSNHKRLLCYSLLNNEPCNYGKHCTYAHSLDEQNIDGDKKYIYQIVLDKNLMNFFSMQNPKTEEIYRYLLFNTHLCDNCTNNKCTGGYNCRNGIYHPFLKLCRNDILTGQCLNKTIELDANGSILAKIDGIEPPGAYTGCINGHHLSERGLLPYYKFVHRKESTKKNKYQSVRYIDINPVSKLIRNYYNGSQESDDESDDTTDEEINSWFSKKEDDRLWASPVGSDDS